MKHILVIAEVFEDLIQPVTLELIAAALRIVDLQQSGLIKVIVPLDDPLPLADKLATQIGLDIIGLKIADLKGYNSDVYKQCLSQLIKTMEPSHILIAHTSQGQDFAPGLAIGLKAASIPGVNEIRSDNKILLYSRSVLGNTRNMVVRPVPGLPVVLTIMPGIFQPGNFDSPEKGQVKILEGLFDLESESGVKSGNDTTRRIRYQKILKKSCENQALKGAKIIVSAGRGIGKKENLETIFQFAQCFSSSSVGASRPLIDMGWMRYEHQVGITGTTVMPKLYISCGISGSSQHLTGMKDAQFVVSINNNPDAPIFRHSDLCIVEDIHEFIQAFLKEAKKDKEI
ncbi:electron transfer flavoprotein subunit alpha/FixB family protein [Desulfobacterales bacterium HSG17]|nr:electron transfer flavoprotein subunit alpha/FixB family protein [Desulfobacterales bacterium HSG17]